MIDKIKNLPIIQKIQNTEFYKQWAQAFAICYPMMVQGDITALTFSHFWKANVTGLIAATIATLSKQHWYKQLQGYKYFPSIVLGTSTLVADLMVHPTHFYGWWTEALFTGIGAGLLSAFFIYKGNKK